MAISNAPIGSIPVGGMLADGKSIALVETFAMSAAITDAGVVPLSEVLTMSDTTTESIVNALRETIALNATMTHTLAIEHSLSDDFELAEAIAVIYTLSLSDSFVVDAALTRDVRFVEHMTDILQLTGLVQSSLDAAEAIAAAFTMADTAAPGYYAALADGFELSAAQVDQLHVTVAQTQGMVFSATAANSVRVNLLVDEALEVGDTLTSTLAAGEQLLDAFLFTAAITIGDDEYVAWVLNTETAAATQYTQYPFNSMVAFAGSYYGASDDGLYELVGDTDDGDAINAAIRTGLTDIGTGKYKQVPTMYLGYTADGSMVLKVITTSSSGAKVEDWYAMTARTASDTRDNRIKVGKGLKSVYWQFELVNTGGADFSIDTITLHPLVLQRRV